MSEPSRPNEGIETAPRETFTRTAAKQTLVVNESGSPVAGASVNLCARTCVEIGAAQTWPRIDWAAMDESMVRMSSDEQGLLDVERLVGSDLAGIWVLHPLHEALWVPLWDTNAVALPERIVLKSAAAWSARVVDLSGTVISGARVVQLFDLRPPGRSGICERPGDPADPRRWLRLVTETDTSGFAALQPLPDRSWVWCEDGSLRSPAWFGSQPAKVELVVGTNFELSGSVTDETDVLEKHELSVRWLARKGTITEWIDTLEVRRDGSIGPLRAPLVPADKYVFQLVGEGVTLDLCEAAPPTDAGALRFELRATEGLRMQVRVLDTESHPVENARVIVTWIQDGLWRSVERPSGSDGEAAFTQVARTTGYVQVRKAGYQPYTSLELTLQSGEPSTFTVELLPGGTIEGRVTHAGVGVKDFTIYFWQGQHENMSRHPVTNAEGGRFVLDQAALGENSLLASSEELTTGEAVTVLVKRDEPAKVELVIPSRVVGRGRVVDAKTMEPIPDAAVQAWVSHGRQLIRTWGSPTRVDGRGAFEMDALHPGTNLLDITAAGYAKRGLHLQVSPDAKVHELGTIGLYRECELVIRFDGPVGTPFSSYSVGLDGLQLIPEQPVSAEGVLRFEGLDPGLTTVWITKPSREFIRNEIMLESGVSHLLVVPVAGRTLTVQVEPDGAKSLPTGLQLRVTHTTQSGRSWDQLLFVPESGTVVVPFVEGQLVVLVLMEELGTFLATKDVELTDSGPTHVSIRPSDRVRTVRVVDRQRQPIQGVTVFTNHPDPRVHWTITHMTDASGECALRGFTQPRILANVFSPALGVRSSVDLDLSPGGRDPIEIVLDPQHELLVRLLDGAESLPWVNLFATDVRGVSFGLSDQSTDETGTARWQRVSTGRYMVEVRHPGFWPTLTELDVGSGSKVHTIQARRLGDLRVVARTKLGNPRANVAFTLRSADLDQDVNTWIEHGRISVEGGVLATSASGESMLRGLAVGVYTWSSIDEDGEARSGTVRVEAGRMGELLIE